MAFFECPGIASEPLFEDRSEAGRLLAARLEAYAGRDDVVVLALPRGGVPVALEVATALGAPLDVLIVRKLGVPTQPELAMGAIASGGVRILNEDVVRSLRLSEETIERAAAEEKRELERREAAYRQGRLAEPLAGKVVIVIDDGVATGATMRAALRALTELGVARTIVGVPTSAADTYDRLRAESDEVVCLATPEPYVAVGIWYRDFHQVSDAEARSMLERAHRARS